MICISSFYIYIYKLCRGPLSLCHGSQNTILFSWPPQWSHRGVHSPQGGYVAPGWETLVYTKDCWFIKIYYFSIFCLKIFALILKSVLFYISYITKDWFLLFLTGYKFKRKQRSRCFKIIYQKLLFLTMLKR